MKEGGALLSIFIPTWNRKFETIRAIGSVGVIPPNVEIIVVEDGSDESNYLYLLEATKDMPTVHIYRNEQNLGMVGNWNKCLSYATGQWVGMLCDDDEYRPGAIERALSLLTATNFPALVLQDSSIEGESILCPKGPESVNGLRLPIASGNFWHRDVIKKVGVFDGRFQYSADGEYWYRIVAEFPVIKVKEPFATYHQHHSNYMWATWRKADFIAQTKMLSTAVASYIYAGSPRRESEIECYVDAAVWGTYLSIIEMTVMSKENFDIFRMYLPKASASATTYSRKLELTKRLIAGVVRRTFCR